MSGDSDIDVYQGEINIVTLMKHFYNKKIYVKEAENPPIPIFRRFCNIADEEARMNSFKLD